MTERMKEYTAGEKKGREGKEERMEIIINKEEKTSRKERKCNKKKTRKETDKK